MAVYGARGTFEAFTPEHNGMGPTLAALTNRVAGAIGRLQPAWRLAPWGVDYPASPWRYRRSRTRGARGLAGLLTAAATGCPAQRFVLLGLSQGADVVRHALSLLPGTVSDRISAVVLLGDPTRHPSDPWQHGTTDPHPGLLAASGTPIAAQFQDAVWGYTLDGDDIAANHHGLLGTLRSGTHTGYEANLDQVLDRAAAFVLERMGLGPTPTPGGQAR